MRADDGDYFADDTRDKNVEYTGAAALYTFSDRIQYLLYVLFYLFNIGITSVAIGQ